MHVVCLILFSFTQILKMFTKHLHKYWTNNKNQMIFSYDYSIILNNGPQLSVI